MKRTALVMIVWMAAVPSAAPAQVTAEPWFRAGTLMMTVEVGGAAFTDFERSQARPVLPESGLGDLSRRVSARTSGSAGAWVSYWVGNGWGVRAGAAYIPTGFSVWVDEDARRRLESEGQMVEPRYASLDIWMLNGSIVFRFPRSFGRVTPYGIVGGGMLRYRASDDGEMPAEARSRFAEGEWRAAAGLFGVGTAIPLQRGNLLLSFELTNHLSRSPLGSADAGERFHWSGVEMELEQESSANGGDEVGLTSHVRLAVGLTLPLR